MAWWPEEFFLSVFLWFIMNDYPEGSHYFVTVTAGLERVAWLDLARLHASRLLEIGHRYVAFAHTGSPRPLLALRCVDDAFVSCGGMTSIGHTRTALETLRAQVADLHLEEALERLRTARVVPERPSFAITASFVGARNYSRYTIADALGAGIREHVGWEYVENTPEEHGTHDVHMRVLLEGERALVGLRLAERPLHRRPYKLASRPGSLKAPVAYAMALLAGVAPGQITLDPLCGVGTIALEAASLAWPTPVLASDLSRAAVADARQNAEGATYTPLLFSADATALPLPNASVDVVVSNLPFGRQVQVVGDLDASYAAIISECGRVLRPGGRVALLTDQGKAVMAALRTQSRLRLTGAHQISLFGLHPIIYVLARD